MTLFGSNRTHTKHGNEALIADTKTLALRSRDLSNSCQLIHTDSMISMVRDRFTCIQHRRSSQDHSWSRPRVATQSQSLEALLSQRRELPPPSDGLQPTTSFLLLLVRHLLLLAWHLLLLASCYY